MGRKQKKKLEGKTKKKRLQSSPDQMLDQAEECMERFEFEKAYELCTAVLSKTPDCVRAVEIMADLLLEAGKPDEAEELLKQLVAHSPDQGHAKYLNLGQMTQGIEAAEFYLKGVEILEKDLASQSKEASEAKALSSMAATGLCSLAELYMTDLCDEENAQGLCKQYLDRALQLDSTSPDVYRTLCSYWISSDDTQKAEEMIKQSMTLWQDAPPVYASKVSTVRLLTELGMYNEALEVVGQLEIEDDEVVEVWYLHGWLGHLTGAKDMAVECLCHAKTLFNAVNCDDSGMLDHIDQLLAEYEAAGLYNPDDEWVEKLDGEEEEETVDEEDAMQMG